MRTITVKLTGQTWLLMHNAQLVDPGNEYVQQIKAITSKPAKGKNAKTEEDLLELQRLEFFGGLYYQSDLGVYMPAENIEGVIRDGAKIARKGKATEAGLVAEDSSLIYEGPRTPDELFADGGFVDRRSVVVNRSRVMRVRPCFRQWALQTTITLISPDMRERDLVSWLQHAGASVGLGDYRPKFGRFSVEVV